MRRVIIPLLAMKVDQLHRLRTRLAEAQAAEAVLTRELLAALQAHGLTRLAGARAIATTAEITEWIPLAALTPAARQARGWGDVHPEDLDYLQVDRTRPILQTTPAPTPKAVAS